MRFLLTVSVDTDLAMVAEPFFLAFGATLDAIPIFNVEELGKAMSAIGPIVQKYG